MSFQISDIILYGPTDVPRVLEFRQGSLNIVTGASKTGKSSLISIVDYCLGASECGVAYGPIRSTVEWYALRLVLASQQILIARKAPSRGQQSSSAVYFEVATEVGIPRKSALSATTNVAAAIELLSRAAGIADNRHEPPSGQTRAPLAAKIKHALYFCFQPQDEIISRKLLFFQQSEPFVSQSIKDVLPYFLGAIGDDQIVKMGRLRELRLNLKRISQKLAEREALRGEGTGRALALLSEAADLGLIQAPTGETSLEQAIPLLTEVLNRRLPTIPDGEATAGAAQYDRLLEERERLSSQLRKVDTDLRAARSLIGEQRGYAAEGAEHAGRLRSIDLMPRHDGARVCPLCSSEIQNLPTDGTLHRALDAVERRLDGVQEDNPHLERLVTELAKQVRDLQQRLAENREATETLQRSQRQVAEYRDFVGKAAHIRGRISIYLEAVPQPSDTTGDLRSQADLIAKEIDDLEQELSDDVVQERLESVLSLVSEHITEGGRYLNLEHSEHPLRLSAKKLTVVADAPGGPISMDKMGAGANWVGYHIVVHLALHRVFVENDRPVPRFLFLDQPSQVYFPADRDTRGRLEVGREGAVIDQDRTEVLRMFALVRDAVVALNGAFQVVITEHADPLEDWYQEAVVERWRDGAALIPQEWIEAIRAPERPKEQ